jgi:hypothetical protein
VLASLPVRLREPRGTQGDRSMTYDDDYAFGIGCSDFINIVGSWSELAGGLLECRIECGVEIAANFGDPVVSELPEER